MALLSSRRGVDALMARASSNSSCPAKAGHPVNTGHGFI
jgi:hypothetical protein